MKQPLWRRWLSYLVDVPVEHISSDYNEALHVLLVRGRYQLCTANVIYSFDDLYVNFRQAFQQLDIGALAPKKVLVLGLGLGSVPLLLENTFGVRAEYTAVEIDEAIIHLADKYSLHQFPAPISYVAAPAEAFVWQCQEQFDLICMDVFQDDTIPESLQSEAFLEALRSLLAPGGLLLYNRLSNLPQDLKDTRIFFDELFRPVFDQAEYLDVGGNWMLLGRRGGTPPR